MTWIDWLIVVVTFVGASALGAWFTRRGGADLKQYFLGGRSLPWYAVSASVAATQLSATTFVALPALVYRPGGDLSFLQFPLIGALLARLFACWLILPRLYAGEVYSPYDLLTRHFGPGGGRYVSVLYLVTSVMAQGARLYLTAVVIDLLLPHTWNAALAPYGLTTLHASVAFMTILAIAWTVFGGIRSVVWTDLLLFGVFAVGAFVMLGLCVAQVNGGVAEIVRVAGAAGKLNLFDTSPDPTRLYTVYAAAIAFTVFGTAELGFDQTLAQRLLCCKSVNHARLALMTSWLGATVPAACMLFGAAVWVYHQQVPLTGDDAAAVAKSADRVSILFVLQHLPVGVRGLILASVFAAAITTVDSALASMAQVSVWLTRWRDAEAKRAVAASRVWVVLWGLVLGTAAVLAQPLAAHYKSVLDLIYASAMYAPGAILGGAVLALTGARVSSASYIVAGTVAFFATLCLQWRVEWVWWMALSVPAAVIAVATFVTASGGGAGKVSAARVGCAGALGLGLIALAWQFGQVAASDGTLKPIAFWWYPLIGTVITLVLSFVGGPRSGSAEATDDRDESLVTASAGH
jgi:Na+/proline symporter